MHDQSRPTLQHLGPKCLVRFSGRVVSEKKTEMHLCFIFSLNEFCSISLLLWHAVLSEHENIATCGQSGMRMWKFRFVRVHGEDTQPSPKWLSRLWRRERYFTSKALGKLVDPQYFATPLINTLHCHLMNTFAFPCCYTQRYYKHDQLIPRRVLTVWERT